MGFSLVYIFTKCLKWTSIIFLKRSDKSYIRKQIFRRILWFSFLRTIDFVLGKGINNSFQVDQSLGVTQLCCPYKCHKLAIFFPSLSFQLFTTLLLPLSHTFYLIHTYGPFFTFLCTAASPSFPRLRHRCFPMIPSHPCADSSILFHQWCQSSQLIAHSYCFGGFFFFFASFSPLISPEDSSGCWFTLKEPMSFGFPGSTTEKTDSS